MADRRSGENGRRPIGYVWAPEAFFNGLGGYRQVTRCPALEGNVLRVPFGTTASVRQHGSISSIERLAGLAYLRGHRSARYPLARVFNDSTRRAPRVDDFLLLPGKTLDGPTRVTVTVRPERIAYFVDPNDPTGALAAIEARMSWRGVASRCHGEASLVTLVSRADVTPQVANLLSSSVGRRCGGWPGGRPGNWRWRRADVGRRSARLGTVPAKDGLGGTNPA